MHRRSDPFGSARNNQNRQRPCALATLGIVATPFSPLPPVQILWPYAGRASVLASHLGTRNIRGLARTLAQRSPSHTRIFHARWRTKFMKNSRSSLIERERKSVTV